MAVLAILAEIFCRCTVKIRLTNENKREATAKAVASSCFHVVTDLFILLGNFRFG